MLARSKATPLPLKRRAWGPLPPPGSFSHGNETARGDARLRQLLYKARQRMQRVKRALGGAGSPCPCAPQSMLQSSATPRMIHLDLSSSVRSEKVVMKLLPRRALTR